MHQPLQKQLKPMNPVPSRLRRFPPTLTTLKLNKRGFKKQSQAVNVAILSAPVLRFTLTMEGVESEVSVTAEAAPVNQDASSPPVTVGELDILRTPGADRAASI